MAQVEIAGYVKSLSGPSGRVFLEMLIQGMTDPENLNVVRKIFAKIGPATPPPKKTASVEIFIETFHHKQIENMRKFLETPTDDFES